METVNIIGFSDPISSWTHLCGAFFFLLASVPLVRRGRGNIGRVSALVIYSFSLVFLFSMSGTFHLLEHAGDARAVLQRLDHAGIWVLIAGTFTPMHVILFRGAWRWLILLIVWLIAIDGLVFEVVFFKSFPEWLALSFFLGLGWMGSLTGYKFRKSYFGESYFWLVGGGVAYSVGAVFDFLRWPVLIDGYLGPHEIFHVFVLLGALSHWIFIWDWADHPISNQIFFEIRVFANGTCEAISKNDNLKVRSTSKEVLRSEIIRVVTEKYHSSIRPEIHLRYFNDEIIVQ